MDEARRKELGGLLRARREQIVRADVGLSPVGRSRRVGLRREEVSYLSGVSLTWYTWLEQGRSINPSRDVIDAVCRTLRLTRAEHAYALSLAGFAPAADPAPGPVEQAPPSIQRLLDAWDGCPAFALASDWGIAGWNTAYEALYSNVARVAPQDRNLLWLVFTDEQVVDLLPDWEVDARRFLAEFRADAAAHLGDPEVAALVSRLMDESEAFRRGWESRDVESFESRERRFRHPGLGPVVYEQHRLVPVDHPALSAVVYIPIGGRATSP